MMEWEGCLKGRTPFPCALFTPPQTLQKWADLEGAKSKDGMVVEQPVVVFLFKSAPLHIFCRPISNSSILGVLCAPPCLFCVCLIPPAIFTTITCGAPQLSPGAAGWPFSSSPRLAATNPLRFHLEGHGKPTGRWSLSVPAADRTA